MELNFLLFPVPKRQDKVKEGEEHLTWIPATDHRDKQYHTKLARTLKEYFVSQNTTRISDESLGVARKIMSKASTTSRHRDGDSTKGGEDIDRTLDSKMQKIGPKANFNRLLSVLGVQNKSPRDNQDEFGVMNDNKEQTSEFTTRDTAKEKYYINSGKLQTPKGNQSLTTSQLKKSYDCSPKIKAEIRAQYTRSSFKLDDNTGGIFESSLRAHSRSISSNCRNERDKKQNVVIQKKKRASGIDIPVSATMCNRFKLPTDNHREKEKLGDTSLKRDFFIKLPKESHTVMLETKKPEPETTKQFIPYHSPTIDSNFNISDAMENIHHNFEESVHLSAHENINKVKQTPVYATKSNGLKFIMKRKSTISIKKPPSMCHNYLPKVDEVPNEYDGIKKRSVHKLHNPQTPSHLIPCLYLKSFLDKDKPSFFSYGPRDPQKVLLIYLHGNGEDLFDTYYVCRLFNLGLRVARSLLVQHP